MYLISIIELGIAVDITQLIKFVLSAYVSPIKTSTQSILVTKKIRKL